MSEQKTAKTPLEGLRVLDLGTLIAGPMIGSYLAEFGADVIKVERPGTGDPLRQFRPIKDGKSLYWKVSARNKQSLTLNLKHPRGQAILKELAKNADIIVENFRPGTLERWNLGYEDLKQVNPGIIMVRISGYGQTGPYRSRPGFGTAAEAMSGLPSFTGFPDKPPTLSPFPLADAVAALFGTFAAMFAVYHRDVKGTGEGQMIDVSLYEPLFRLLESQVVGYEQLGIIKERRGNLTDETAPRNAYKTQDGEWIAISASSQRTFERLMTAVGRPDLIDDPRFADNTSRVEHVDELDAVIIDWFKQHTWAEIKDIFDEHGVVASPVYNIEKILQDIHYQEREDIIQVEDVDFGTLAMQNVVPRLSETPGQVNHPGPKLGEHTAEILKESLGLSQEDIERLQADGVI